jgi:hypothetical protein
MYTSKKLNGNSDDAQENLDFVTQNDIAPLVTQLQLETATSTLVTSVQLQTATSTLVTSVQLQTATSELVTPLQLQTATSELVTPLQLQNTVNTLASKTDVNYFEQVNFFERHTLFRQKIMMSSDYDIQREVPDAGGIIYVFRELESLRTHWTTPEWITAALDQTHYQPGYYPNPQYVKFKYGGAWLVKMRGDVNERSGTDYLNSEDTRVLFVLPIGYRPTRRHVFVCAGGNGAVVASVLVNTNGEVLFMAQSSFVDHAGSVASVWLDSISFFVDAVVE